MVAWTHDPEKRWGALPLDEPRPEADPSEDAASSLPTSGLEFSHPKCPKCGGPMTIPGKYCEGCEP